MAPRGARRREPVCESGGTPRVSKRRNNATAHVQRDRSDRRDARAETEPETIAASYVTTLYRRLAPSRPLSLPPPARRRLRACQTGAAVANGEAVQRCSAEIQIALSRTSRHAVAFTATIADRKLTGGGAKE